MKKLLISFLLGLTVFFSFTPYLTPVKAQTWYSQDPFEWYLKVYDQNTSPADEIFGERYTAAQVQWVVYSFLFLPVRAVESLVGENSITCFIKLFGTSTADITSCTGAITTFMGKAVDVLPKLVSVPGNNNQSVVAAIFNTDNRDLSGMGYTKNLLNKFSLVSTVKAQGFGYGGLSWVQTYWKGFRDISYVLLVLVIIVFAFMIMFRVKLSPQTVVSVQSALPKVIMAMILITFSYAIAGFAVDLMYVISGFFALLLNLTKWASIGAAYQTISGTGPGYAWMGGFWVFFEMLGYAILFFFAAVSNFATILLSGFNIFGAVLALVFVIMTVWVLVLVVWYTFKVPYVLIKTLISLYISIITAPVQILAGAIVPSMGFGSWFKRVMADILVFPVTGLLFWFAWATLFQSYVQAGVSISSYYTSVFGNTPNVWVPGIIGSSGLGAGSGISGLIFLAISFGIIALIPKVPDMLKGLVMGERFSFGTAIGEAYGPVKGIAGGATGIASGIAGGAGAGYLANRMRGTGWETGRIRGAIYKGLRGYEQKMQGAVPGSERKTTHVNKPGEAE